MVSLLRRRAMMVQAAAPAAEKLFVGASYGGTSSRGSKTQYGDGAFRIRSTGNANWSLFQNAYGSASLFKTFEDIKGHTIRFTFNVSNLTLVSGGEFLFSATLTSGITASNFTRTRYQERQDPIELGVNTWLFVVPTTLDGWGAGSGGSDTDYFTFRFYLHSNSGSDITVSEFSAYDLGII